MSTSTHPVTVAMPDTIWAELRTSLEHELETAWVLIARPIGGGDGAPTTLLVRAIVPIADDAYEERRPDGLRIASRGWVGSFGTADRDEAFPIFVHSHSSRSPEHSKKDFRVDDQLAPVAEVRTSLGHYASLVVGGTPTDPSFAGRYKVPEQHWQPVDRLRIVGSGLAVLEAWSPDAPLSAPQVFDRQVRAFGEDGQAALGRLRVGVVGAGGTGSAVIEQLIRLGVGHLTVIDPQALTDTNVTRVYGSTLSDEGEQKVVLARRQAERIGLGTDLEPIKGTLLTQDVAKALLHCDVLFGCTDDHAGRTLLTRMPQALLQLLVDCGVRIDSRNERINDIFGRLSIVTPTSPCLVCMREIDQDRAAAELLSPDEYERLAAEGYAPELDTQDPAVVTFTTAIASYTINELLIRMFAYGEVDGPNRILLRMGDRSISKSRRPRVGNHRCGRAHLLAAGERQPFLDWGWADG